MQRADAVAAALDHLKPPFSSAPPHVALGLKRFGLCALLSVPQLAIVGRVRLGVGRLFGTQRQVARVVQLLRALVQTLGLPGLGRRHERIERLVISNTAAFTKPPGKPLPGALRVARDWSLGEALVRGLNTFVEVAVRTCTVKPMSAALAAAYRALRRRVAGLEGDRFLAPDLAEAERVVVDGALVAAVEKKVGPLAV